MINTSGSGAAGPFKVSVILPVRNGAEVILTQLKALLMQTNAPRYEVIVVDNRSSDATAQIVREFASDCSSGLVAFRLIPAHDFDGVSYARNVGIRYSQASKLLFCDADDCVSEYWIRQGADLLDEAEVFSGAAVPVPDEDFGHDVPRLRGLMGDRPEVAPLNDDQHAAPFPVLMGGNCGMTRGFALKVGGFDQSLPIAGEDNDLALRVRAAGLPVLSTPCVRVAYRIRTRPRQVWSGSRRSSRAHALNAVRHRLWSQSEVVGRGRWLSGWLRAWLVLGIWSINPRRALWTEIVGRLGVAQGALEGAILYRVLRQIPPPNLGLLAGETIVGGAGHGRRRP